MDAQCSTGIVVNDLGSHFAAALLTIDTRVATIIFTQSEVAISTGEDKDFQRLGIPTIVNVLIQLLEGDDPTCWGKNRKKFQWPPHIQAQPTIHFGIVAASGKEIEPLTAREPHAHARLARVRIARGHHGSNHQLRAEHELFMHVVGDPFIWVRPVHGSYQRRTLRGSAPVHRVQVRNEAVTQDQRIAHDIAHGLLEIPRFLAHERRQTRVQSVNRAEYTQLVPACFQFFVAHAQHVSANVVAPPAVSDIRGR